MWILEGPRFKTARTADPFDHFDPDATALLENSSEDDLGPLFMEAYAKEAEVKALLEASNLVPDETDEFVWQPLPESIQFHLPASGASFVQQVDAIEIRWRLDAAIALVEAILIGPVRNHMLDDPE